MNLPHSSPRLHQTRVLVVDDDPLIRTQLMHLVRGRVGAVESAADGAAGLEKWRRWHPDVIITDIMMPVMDGLDMSAAIKAEEPDAQIIVISSSSDTEYLRRAIDIGVDRYVLKPVDVKLLLDAIDKCYRDHQRLLDLRMAKLVFEVANEGIMVTDATPRILAVNPAFTEITGYRPDEAIGRKTNLLSSGQHEATFYRAMWESLRSHGRWAGEIVNRRKDGTVYAEWLSVASMESLGRGTQRYVGLISDISERKQAEERIRRLAHFDALTGLPNRTLFADRLQRALAAARRHDHGLALLFLDLDRFKPVNDEYGHAFGDALLKEVAQRMADCVRQEDTIGRQGGDEFVILLEHPEHPESAGVVSRKLIDSLSQPFQIQDKTLSIGASVGIAVYPKDGGDAQTLLHHADLALYEAKNAGRGGYQFFQPSAQAWTRERLDLEHELREGLTNWRYSLRYLPEICLATGQVEHVEALLRFHHPRHGLLNAGRFLEVAETIGLMPELGRLALAQAARELRQLAADGQELGLVVDLSRRQLTAEGAVEGLLETLGKAGLAHGEVTFECPESALTGSDAALQTLFRLAAAGCKFTLDDFGAGFCSFSLIRQLPMSSIKIDRGFVREIEHSSQSRELVAALIAFARRLHLRTIAEGVETPAQLAILLENQCQAAQGYLFGQPMDLPTLRTYLAEQRWRPSLTPQSPR